MHRQAAVAGAFYPADAESVKKFITQHEQKPVREDAAAVLVPHAGYIYSGATAVRTLSQINIPDKVILAGPNHTGAGPAVSVYPEGSWETPFGDVPMDSEMIEKLCADPLFCRDTSAHREEHSLEVIMPLLKYFNPDVKAVCITTKFLGPDEIKSAASHISACADGHLFVISSDFNHFEDSDTTEEKDAAVLEKLMAADFTGLYTTAAQRRVSMCGVIPACLGIEYALCAGAGKPVFVEHTHSGHVNGDNTRVVGYAGLYYKKEDLQ